MNNRLVSACLVCAATLLQVSAGWANEPPRLANNPFTRPPSIATVVDRPEVMPDGSTRELDLRATMVASNSKLANVGGRTIRPGDEVDGYTLLQVFEDRAVFVRGNKRLTIHTKPDPEEDED